MPIRELLRCSVTRDLFSIFRMQEEFEDTKGVIKSKKTNQWPKEKDKRTNNDLQNITHKTEDQVARVPVVIL